MLTLDPGLPGPGRHRPAGERPPRWSSPAQELGWSCATGVVCSVQDRIRQDAESERTGMYLQRVLNRAHQPGGKHDGTGMSAPETHLVVFSPSGRRGRFEAGTPVLDAARELGVDLDSVCGGRALCGRCQVDPLRSQWRQLLFILVFA